MWSRDRRFPTFTTSAANFRGSAPKMLAGIDPKHVALIERYQPYNTRDPDAHAFALLNALTREDKHEIVPATGGFMRPASKPNIRFTLDPRHGSILFTKLAKSRHLKGGADVARCKLAPLSTNPDVQMYGDLPLDIAFGERSLRGTALQEIGTYVSGS